MENPIPDVLEEKHWIELRKDFFASGRSSPSRPWHVTERFYRMFLREQLPPEKQAEYDEAFKTNEWFSVHPK